METQKVHVRFQVKKKDPNERILKKSFSKR